MLKAKLFSLFLITLALVACEQRSDDNTTDTAQYYYEEGTRYLGTTVDASEHFETYFNTQYDYVEWLCALEEPYAHLNLRLNLPYESRGYATLENLRDGAASAVSGDWYADDNNLYITDPSTQINVMLLSDYEFSGITSFSATMDVGATSGSVAVSCVLVDEYGYPL